MVLRQPSGAGAPSQRAYKRKGSMSDESVPEARPASDEPAASMIQFRKRPASSGHAAYHRASIVRLASRIQP